MKYRGFSLLLIAALLIVNTSACVRIEIGDNKAEATIGEQLTDLVEAKKLGAVSESEFKEVRNKLLSLD